MSTPADSDLARRYVAGNYGKTTAFFRGQWQRYEDGLWKPLHRYEIGAEVRRILEAAQQEGVRPTSSKAASVESLLRTHMFVKDELIDANPDLVNLQNGVYDLENDGGAKSHSPKFYMTTQLPFELDLDAKAPLWQMYLESTFVRPQSTEPDHELIHFVQECVGYSLTTDISHHVTMWAIGSGANGKGVLFHILLKLAGDAAIPLNVGLLQREQYQLAQLAGKRIALCSETKSRGSLLEDDLIKSLVSGDPITVRQIRQIPFILYPVCKLWLAANVLPIITDTSEGLWRRIMVVPFNREFYNRRKGIDNRILDLKERLEDELPGIFLWAMEGLQRLRHRGKFEMPAQVAALTEQYRFESNPIELFIEDKCDINHDDPNYKAASASLYATYKDWCIQNTYKPRSSRNFKREMERLGFYAKRGKAGVFFCGLREKPLTWGNVP